MGATSCTLDRTDELQCGSGCCAPKSRGRDGDSRLEQPEPSFVQTPQDEICPHPPPMHFQQKAQHAAALPPNVAPTSEILIPEPPGSDGSMTPPAPQPPESPTVPLAVPPPAVPPVLVERPPTSELPDGPSAPDVGTRSIFEVVLDRRGGTPLGLKVEARKTEGILVVRSIGNGLVKQWNMEHPNSQMSVDDIVCEVNGLRGDALQMMQKCIDEQILRLVVVDRKKSLR